MASPKDTEAATPERLTGRQLKKKVLALLERPDLPAALDRMRAFPGRRVINPLFGLLYHRDEIVRWRAVVAMGAVTAGLVDKDLESARIIMRRLMWNLNDESGGIGWGSPEAMGEIMARDAHLASEFAHILVSYLWPEGNYLEHPLLQRGVLWGVGRLGRVRPERVQAAGPLLLPFLTSPDTHLRGLAAWAAAPLLTSELTPALQALKSDCTLIDIFMDGALVPSPLAQLARQALGNM